MMRPSYGLLTLIICQVVFWIEDMAGLESWASYLYMYSKIEPLTHKKTNQFLVNLLSQLASTAK